METLPNGLVVFNATPHAITFGCGEGYNNLVTVMPDQVITAVVEEVERDRIIDFTSVDQLTLATLVTTNFVADEAGCEIIDRARRLEPDVIVGSIIAAQAYRGSVVAMVACPGYERVPPAEKRMRCDKFTIF